MKVSNPKPMLDAVAEQEDVVELTIHRDLAGGHKIYININGECVCRIGRIVNLKSRLDSQAMATLNRLV